MKLCKDCKWSHADDLGDRFMECHAPQNVVRVKRKLQTRLITGGPLYDEATEEYRFTYCTTHRGSLIPWMPSTCGRWGRWFERYDMNKRP